MKENKVEKFSALSDQRIIEIIDRCKDKDIVKWLAPIARKSQELLNNPQYSNLRNLRKNLTVEELNNHLDEIAIFLRDCRLIGAENENEKISISNYVIGAEGVALINEYMASKPNNFNAHQIKVIKNQDFADKNNSHQYSNVVTSQKAIHSAFGQELTKDLLQAQENNKEFNKTYLIEAFGTTGGNHFFAVTVRKNPDEKSPLIDFFDPSTALLRGNIETLQNSIASGWTAQIAVNATLTKALKDAGLDFDLSKYYNNIEPLQMRGSSNCSVFAYEKAYITANMSREEHEALLEEHYKFDSPFGGKTELKIDDIGELNQSESGQVTNPQLNMPPQYMAMTHFNENAKIYLKDMEEFVHKRKERASLSEESIIDDEESAKERRDRYLRKHIKQEINKDTQEIENKTFFTNELITQKHYRQKYGHLFEIVTHPKFAELGEQFSQQELPSNEYFKDSVYKPQYLESEKPQNPMAEIIVNGKKCNEEEKAQGYKDIRGLNQILPFPVRIVEAKYNEKTNNCEALLYGSERLATRLKAWAQENEFDIKVEDENFQENGFDFTGLNDVLAKRSKVTLVIPVTEESITKVSSSDEKKFLHSTPLTLVESNKHEKALSDNKERTK